MNDSTQSFRFDQGLRFEQVFTLKRVIMIGALLMSMSLMALGVSTAHGAPASWKTSFSGAVRDAQKASKPVLLVIGHEGCTACESFELELKKPAASRALRNAVKVWVEASDNPELTSRYGSATPTVVLFSPEVGYDTPVMTQVGGLSSSDLQAVGRSINSMMGRQ